MLGWLSLQRQVGIQKRLGIQAKIHVCESVCLP